MSSARPSESSTSSNRSNRSSARIVAQTTVDAKLAADFEEQGRSFDYSKTVIEHQNQLVHEHKRSDKVTAYLQQIQRGTFIQPFGCLLAIDEKTFRVTGYSENAPEMLTMVAHAVPSVGEQPTLGIGTDIRNIFTGPSTAALQKALGFGEVSLLNPILVHCKTSGKPFYAILHRVTGCLIVDFEPVKPSELPMTAAGALQSYKLAAKAISRLQSLPGGIMQRLCDTIVQEVFELTGYDRVMTYYFHDDDHGEVIAEVTKPGLDPYKGIHYPATDIPQAARFLFMKNKVRMICNCRAKPVRVFQDENLPFNITFCGSNLRAPHICHLQYMENMHSIASLVMAVVINQDVDEDMITENGPQQEQPKRKRLWGLVVCHNESPRFVPFPLRYACEFLAQVFALHVSKELELERQICEKNMLRTQTMLCDMLLRDAPLGIIKQSPNIMDLVKCDGAALLYQNNIWRLGQTPTDYQIRSIAKWLSEYHMDSTGLSTDSLYEAGYPDALSLGDAVCGMAAARITSNDILFWFRSHTAAEIQWGGQKHVPGEKDDGTRMHPRSSFKAFLEVVKTRSMPWKDYEMDAIHSLQLILRGSFIDSENRKSSKIDARISELKLEEMVELQSLTNEMVRLIENATVPIFAVDVSGLVNGWNIKIAELTGLSVEHAIAKDLLSLVEESSVDTVKQMLSLAFRGEEEENVCFEMKTFGPKRDDGPVVLVVNACASRDAVQNVVGVCFIAQDITNHKVVMDKFMRIEGDYKAIVQNPNPLIPPIFGADEFGWCSEWNSAMTKLSGWNRDDVIDKMLLGEIFGINKFHCRLKNEDELVNLGVLINNAMTGHLTEQIPFGFFSRSGKHVECLLSVSKKVHADGVITGVVCFLHIASHELQKQLHVQRLSEQSAARRLRALSYIRHEIQNPLSGIMYTRQLLENMDLVDEQKQLLETGAKCHCLLNKILDDLNLESILDSGLTLEMNKFTLIEILLAAISQVMIPCRGKGIQIVHDLHDDLMTEALYGDSLRLQQIISDFLLVSLNYSASGSLIEITANVTKNQLSKSLQVVRLELRIKHTGSTVPEDLLSQMFDTEEVTSEEGISLLVCRKLLRLMNGDVQYLSEAGKSSFIICVELASAK